MAWGKRAAAASVTFSQPQMLEVGTSGGDRLEPGVRHVTAVGKVEVLELGAPGGDRLESPSFRI